MIPKFLLDDMNDALDSGDAATRAALTTRLSDQPEAQAAWDAMQSVEQKLNAAPMIAPSAGFVQRFEARRVATQSSSGKAWLAFFGGVIVTGGVAASAPLIIGLAFYVREVWEQEIVFALIVRNTVESIAAIARALFTSVIALAEIAIPNPMMWLTMLGAVGIVGVWLYLINKLSLEVSLT
ncbi:MAG: hypothetical protein HZB52_05890 [Chloroflexi bacterium]|nr:hypothetical protein [Chloroflexota bacterium]